MNEAVIELNNQIATFSNEILNSKKDSNSSILIYKKDNLENIRRQNLENIRRQNNGK